VSTSARSSVSAVAVTRNSTRTARGTGPGTTSQDSRSRPARKAEIECNFPGTQSLAQRSNHDTAAARGLKAR
jgi:hypothetical protein